MSAPTDTARPPNAFGIDVTLIPPALRVAHIWLCWRYMRRDPNKKPTKVPCQPNGAPASTIDPNTWHTLDEVLAPTVKVDGVGLVFTGEVGPDGLCTGGIDLDALTVCRKGETDNAAMFRRLQRANCVVREAKALDAYVERSPSGSGVHIIGQMRPLAQGVNTDSVEMYTSGRYFTFTTKLAKGGLADISELVEGLLAELGRAPDGTPSTAPSATPLSSPDVTARVGAVAWQDLPADVQSTLQSWLHDPADGGTQDRELRQRLWDGDASDFNGDGSAGDLSMVSQLIHRGLTDEQADQALRASGRYRAKWDEKRGATTYGQRTIATARQSFAAATGLGSSPNPSSSGPGPGGAGVSPQPQPSPGSQPPVIEVFEHQYPRVMREGLAALHGASVPLFRQETRLVQVCDIPVKEVDGSTSFKPGVERVLPSVLGCLLADVAQWRKRNMRGLVRGIAPPKEVVAMMLDKHDEWPFLSLRGVATTPVMRPDGSLLTTPGYDPASGLFLFRPPVLPPIPAQPSWNDAWAALMLLWGLLNEFPFANDGGVSQAAGLAALLTGVQRPMLDTAPFFLANKPASGSGGTYLCELIGTLATGKKPAPVTWSGGKEEAEKRLDSLLLAKFPVILIDNIVGELKGEKFCVAGSSSRVLVRVMGGNTVMEIDSTALLLGSGNNVSIVDDEIRRTVVMMLDANMADPSVRVFTGNPIADVLARRGDYIAAVLTILRAFVVAGRPGLLPARAGYEAWSDQVRSALVWLGCADPCLSTDRLRVQDPVAAQREAVFDAWLNELGGATMRPKELIAAAHANAGYSNTANAVVYTNPAWRDALLEVAAQDKESRFLNHDRFNWWLRDTENKVARGFKLVADRSDRSRPRWGLRPV
jgi:putative DNA primase/helicase